MLIGVVIFLDMEMPEQNGIETGLIIKSIEKCIMICGYIES